MNLYNNTIQEKLLKAAEKNQPERVRALIEAGAKIDGKNHLGETALYRAAEKGSTEVVKLLIEMGSDIYLTNTIDDRTILENQEFAELTLSFLSMFRDDNTPVIIAGWRGHAEIVKLLVEADKKINIQVKKLIIAVCDGDAEAVDEHLTVFTEPLFKEYMHNNIHLMALDLGHTDIIKVFIEKGMDLNMRVSGDDHTPLIAAASRGHIKIVRLLIESGADVNPVTKECFFASVRNIGSHDLWSDMSKSLSTIGNTALMEAAKEGHIDVVKLLIEKGADVSIKKENGRTALIEAAEKGHIDVVKLLIENGVDVNAKEYQGNTALMKAAYEGCVDVVTLLIKKGADINLRNDNRRTALWLAGVNCQTKIVEMLLGSTFISNPQVKKLVSAMFDMNIEEVKKYLNIKNIEQVEEFIGLPAIIIAAIRGYNAIIKLLIQCGMDIEGKACNDNTVLIEATISGHYDTVKLLIENEANVNAAGDDTWTALFEAGYEGHYDIAKLLIENDADINVLDDYERTALVETVRQGQTDVVKLLIDNGANVNILDGFGWTILDYAEDAGHDEIIELLKAAGAEE